MKNLSGGFKTLVILFALGVFALYYFSPCLVGDNAVYYSERSSLAVAECRADYVASHGFNYIPVKAESAFFAQKRDIADILSEYGARVAFVEEVDGITNYYCRSPRLPVGVRLKGKEINLHVAVAEYGYTLGIPMIYGGY